MTDQPTRFVGRLRTGEIVLVLPPEVARLLIETHDAMVSEEPQVHRTSVSDMDGDIFDSLALEMGNDAVAKGALEKIENVSGIMSLQLSNSIKDDKPTMLRLTPDVCSNLLLWVNNLYTYSRRDVLDSATVGEGQSSETDLDGDEVSMSTESYILMCLAEELVVAWGAVD